MAADQRISVIIPTYNRANMLRATVMSVLAQTAPVHEIVVVDDGSTDQTASLISELADGGAPIMLVAQAHTNQRGKARNRGVEASSGNLLAFLDSDDLWKPDRIRRQLAAWEGAPEAGFAFCNVQRFEDSGSLGGEPCLAAGVEYNGYILGDLLEEPLVISSTLMVKREVFESMGGFAALRMNEDYELSLRLAERSTASYVPDVLVLMREHAGRTSRLAREMPLLDYISIVEGFLAQRPGLPPQTMARARRGLANVHLKLARHYLDYGDRREARRHVLALIKLRPTDRRAISTLLRSLYPTSHKPTRS